MKLKVKITFEADVSTILIFKQLNNMLNNNNKNELLIQI